MATWFLTYDHLDDKPCHFGTVSKAQADALMLDQAAGLVKFKLYDDDGELYYTGYSDCLDECEDLALAPLDWAMGNAGCTAMKIEDPATGNWSWLAW